jgi:hypothetical protein
MAHMKVFLLQFLLVRDDRQQYLSVNLLLTVEYGEFASICTLNVAIFLCEQTGYRNDLGEGTLTILECSLSF